MKNPYRRHNPKFIALVIEISILVIFIITGFVLEGIGKPIHWTVLLVFTGVLLFAIFLTLSLIKYDSIRDIRESFKDTNLPLYTDQTTLLGHDIKDENTIK